MGREPVQTTTGRPAYGAPRQPRSREARAGAPRVPRLEVEARAAAMLRHASTALVPLDELSRALRRELGEEAGDRLTLRERLVARPDLFLVLERGAPFLGAEGWPAAERSAYDAALRAEGWDAGPLVGAAPASGREAAPETPQAHVASALAELAAAAARDDTLRDRVSEALPVAQITMQVLADAFNRSLGCPTALEQARAGCAAASVRAAQEGAPPLGLDVLDEEHEPGRLRRIQHLVGLLLQDAAQDQATARVEGVVEGGEERAQDP